MTQAEEKNKELKAEIDISDLGKVDIRVGTIVSAEKVEGSEKLIKLLVDFGELGTRQILTAMQTHYSPEEMVGMQTTFVVNLKPRKMMGLESQGMIFAVDSEKPTFLIPQKSVKNGETVI